MQQEKKVKLGQFFTKESVWLKPQIFDFIKKSGCCIAYDPFAGKGDLLSIAQKIGFHSLVGLDIDPFLNWTINDSLLFIPPIENAIIITNPPYLAKQSASRKKIDLSQYFDKSIYDDLYLIALEQMTKSQKYIVAIIPESFINSNYLRKDLLNSITILEENPFLDTEVPVCVACFDGHSKDLKNVKVYKNDQYVGTLEQINKIRLKPKSHLFIKFNDLNGWLGLRAIDSTAENKTIKFAFKEEIKYDWTRIKQTSRHITLINVDIPKEERFLFIQEANSLIEQIRHRSKDILLTPFKGNTKKGIRRRRLDFSLARAILENAYQQVVQGERDEQLRLF